MKQTGKYGLLGFALLILKACVQMRSARGQKAIDSIFLPLIFMSTVTGWDGSSLWMPYPTALFRMLPCVFVGVRTGTSYGKSAHGAHYHLWHH